MDREQVSSTSIASVGYDGQSLTIEIEYVGGGVYQYFAVPREVYDGLLHASSKGAYVNAYIRNAGYDYARV